MNILRHRSVTYTEYLGYLIIGKAIADLTEYIEHHFSKNLLIRYM
ncbi:MAG: hypothetical protein RMX97_23495 [Nostoc sp. DedQUE11]|nr:hypothetical protein [Nostoc sp. DedQUE11]